MAGYSDTPLAKKLGIKEGMVIRLISAPANYNDLVGDIAANVNNIDDPGIKKNFIHFFIKDANELESMLLELKNEIVPNGMIWVSWQKKTKSFNSLISENEIRNTALKTGLVDVKVCAFDEQWSALKLVIRVKNR